MDFNAAKRYWKKGNSEAQNTPLRRPRGHISNIPEQCGSSGLSERLQQLYSDVISDREEAGAADAGNEAPSHEGNSRGFAMTDPSTTRQDAGDGQTQPPAQAPPDDVLSLTQRPAVVVSKAKKRKAKGLFT